MKCNVSYKYLFIAIGILCPLFSACDYADGEGSGSENAVYMETPDNKGIVNFTLEPDGGITYLTPRLANISQSPGDYTKWVMTKRPWINTTRTTGPRMNPFPPPLLNWQMQRETSYPPPKAYGYPPVTFQQK